MTWKPSNKHMVGRVIRQRRARRGQSMEEGLTFVELLMAMTLLTVGLVAVLGLITIALASNNRNKKDTTAILLSQTVLELLDNIPANIDDRTITITDCVGTSWTITSAPGGAPLESGTTNIDWSSSYTTASYSMRYETCGLAGQTAKYDVRWNIQRSGSLKTVVVAARQMSGTEKSSAILFAAPAQLKTIFGL
jgi:Tfp pilus assembly protein PilV